MKVKAERITGLGTRCEVFGERVDAMLSRMEDLLVCLASRRGKRSYSKPSMTRLAGALLTSYPLQKWHTWIRVRRRATVNRIYLGLFDPSFMILFYIHI